MYHRMTYLKTSENTFKMFFEMFFLVKSPTLSIILMKVEKNVYSFKTVICLTLSTKIHACFFHISTASFENIVTFEATERYDYIFVFSRCYFKNLAILKIKKWWCECSLIINFLNLIGSSRSNVFRYINLVKSLCKISSFLNSK